MRCFLCYRKLRKPDHAVLRYLDISKTWIGKQPPAGIARFLYFVDIAAAHRALPFAFKKDHFSFLQGFLHVDDILIGGTAEEQRSILQIFLERTIHENVDVFQKCKAGFGIADRAL